MIHPNHHDFGIAKNDCGRLLISKPLGEFYTDYQKTDREVIIKAVLPPEYLNETVYFQVHDPLDMSPYAQGATIGDNEYKLYELFSEEGNNTFSIVNSNDYLYSIKPVLEEVNSEIEEPFKQFRAVATVTLRFTDRYSGDNYKVFASLDPDMPEESRVETVCMVAWKRVNVEKYSMQTQGTYNKFEFNPELSLIKNRLICGEFFYNTNFPEINEFNIGDEIEIFDKYGVLLEASIDMIVDGDFNKQLFLDQDISITIPEFCGIRVKNDRSTFSDELNNKKIENAYGKNTCGLEDDGSGGAFVELKFTNSSVISPSFDLAADGTFGTFNGFFLPFIEYWLDITYNNGVANTSENVIKSIWARNNYDNSSLGAAQEGTNLVLIYSEACENTYGQDYVDGVSHTFSHEIAHQFDVQSNHFHNEQTPFVSDHTGHEACIIQYPDIGERISIHNEFDSLIDGCIYDIRNQIDPR